MQKRKQCVFITGVPGAGKDTQSKGLFDNMPGHFDAVISMSGLIEAALEAVAVVGYTEADKAVGKLLSDEMTGAVLEERLEEYSTDSSLAVSGYPRTRAQAEFAIDYCQKRGWVPIFLILRVEEDIAMERVRIRRAKDLKEKGRSRPDDEESVARARYRKQQALLDEVVPRLRTRLLTDPGWLFPVDCSGTPDEVFRRMVDFLTVAA